MQIELDDWQRKIVESQSRRIVLDKGRQVGGTTTFSTKCGEELVNEKRAEIVVLSLTEDQAKLVIIMVLDYLQKNYKKLICSGKDKPTQSKIKLKNGNWIISRPL